MSSYLIMTELRKILPFPTQREKIQRLVKTSPSPSLARSNLARLVESGGAGALKNFPEDYYLSLIRLLGGSAYLSDVLIREGERWPDLFLRQIAIEANSAADHVAALAPVLQENPSLESFASALRRYKQREYLRIGARDLLPSTSVEETMRELTALAEASLEIAYRFSRREVERDYGKLILPSAERNNRFVILGMGKLGGEELNFSSDVDLIYFYEEEDGESAGGAKGRIAPRGFFEHVAEKITRAVGEVTEEGFVFRTDLRLRPLGRNGPLVQPVASAALYYESWGQCWERSALIKARPVAGDKDLGAEFLREVEPFIYRRYLDFTTVEELRHMKMRIEKELLLPQDGARNLKLGRGGIREIEFFTQALQLLNGGYHPGIREHNTLRALSSLAHHDLIPFTEAAGLSEAYRFLRQVEHKIQMLQEAHAHSIPEGRKEELALSRRLGYSPSPGKSERRIFWRDYRRHTVFVRRAFDRLFYSAQKEIRSGRASTLEEMWSDLDQEKLIIEQLAQLGFEDPETAYRNLLAVRDGEEYAPPSPRRLKVMRALGPALLAETTRSGSPDQALFNLAEFSHRVGARTGFLSLLAENPKTMRLLITLFANSQFLTDLFLKRPELLDTLIRVDLTQMKKSKEQMRDELRMSLSEAADVQAQLNALRRYRAEEFIRIGLHDLGGSLELAEVIGQLSDLADTCLEDALSLAAGEIEKSFGKIDGGRFAVVGMGKLGGREIDYNSDLDLIFIYAAPEIQSSGGKSGSLAAHEYYVRLGQKLITYLTAPTEEGVAYKLDLRLRPSGRSGPLVSSVEAFRYYHQTSSALWERQALTKSRFVAGDAELGKEAEKITESFAYARDFTGDDIAAIHHLRMRMEKELAKEDPAHFDLKKGKGGMVDIEFVTQMLQLCHGFRLPQVRQRSTMDALSALRENQVLNKSEYRLLSEGYLFLRRLDHRLRLERDQSIDILEREPVRLRSVAQALGYKTSSRRQKQSEKDPGERLLRDYELWRERIRACYDRHFSPRQESPQEQG
ncbi:MAG: bifunctional [glutamate--ammonia ligase]-adenylyl-L-tyrosine phosphorylase/[glutamate--ammonia-ligase] adenylyltransferase [Deltaproteobacteria bacterium]|nr:bifunctional [glutamate--ammonia ligase]-adenylyl-L-tyrosine phosphorylase/[glutamate--ammonia-ligase] adenylyltransferase [Deltaproteobacteria bacterium]